MQPGRKPGGQGEDGSSAGAAPRRTRGPTRRLGMTESGARGAHENGSRWDVMGHRWFLLRRPPGQDRDFAPLGLLSLHPQCTRQLHLQEEHWQHNSEGQAERRGTGTESSHLLCRRHSSPGAGLAQHQRQSLPRCPGRWAIGPPTSGLRGQGASSAERLPSSPSAVGLDAQGDRSVRPSTQWPLVHGFSFHGQLRSENMKSGKFQILTTLKFQIVHHSE